MGIMGCLYGCEWIYKGHYAFGQGILAFPRLFHRESLTLKAVAVESAVLAQCVYVFAVCLGKGHAAERSKAPEAFGAGR